MYSQINKSNVLQRTIKTNNLEDIYYVSYFKTNAIHIPIFSNTRTIESVSERIVQVQKRSFLVEHNLQ